MQPFLHLSIVNDQSFKMFDGSHMQNLTIIGQDIMQRPLCCVFGFLTQRHRLALFVIVTMPAFLSASFGATSQSLGQFSDVFALPMKCFVPEVLLTRLQEERKQPIAMHLTETSISSYRPGYVELTLEQHQITHFEQFIIVSHKNTPLQWDYPSQRIQSI